MTTEEKNKKITELKENLSSLEKDREAEANGQKKGQITKQIKAVKTEIENLEKAEVSDSVTPPASGEGDNQQTGGADTSDNNQTGNNNSGDNSSDNNGSDSDNGIDDEDKISVSVKNKTGGRYRRCGFIFKNEAVTVSVTEEQLKILKKDPWLEIKEV